MAKVALAIETAQRTVMVLAHTTKQGKSVVQRTARTVFVTDRAERTVTRLARITKRENSAAQKTKAGTALVTGNNN